MGTSARITILTGHYGSGKTELAINLAINARKNGEKVAVCDLDIVNPYFRSRDASALFREHSIKLVAPPERLATADLPIIPAEILAVVKDEESRVIIDAGGDKEGAAVLGQFFHEWKDGSLEVLFVLNASRPYVSTLDGALYTVRQIEKASRLTVTGIINNTNLGASTTIKDIQKGQDLSIMLSHKLGKPVKYTFLESSLRIEGSNLEMMSNKMMTMDRYLKLPWE
ncbi:ATP-binding protein [Mesobacillus zeae]|uniref:nucleotide-binding protein n=1 Tax=Mesobacillus zeae TaxID=1917180 RepID=UPI0015E7A064|nr:ATP-binding protein [Mesobacillus zeae]